MLFQKESLNPFMGVLVSPKTTRNLRRQIVNHRIKWLVDANEEVNNVLYYFSLKHVKPEERTIVGYYWHRRRQKWVRGKFPFPDILYIRGGISSKYIHIFEELYGYVSANGWVINYPRFNKWELYQILSKDPQMKSYLPETLNVSDAADIKRMLQEYKVVYLKPHLGRQGKKVLRVEAHSESCYHYSYQKHDQLVSQYAIGFAALQRAINSCFRGKGFLVQQSIDLIKYDNRLVDLRAELQRNGNGEVEIVCVSARLAQLGSPITTHADAFRFDHFFMSKLNYSEERIRSLQANVHEFLLKTYRAIEQHYGEYVEIGIDFAIDTNEQIWLIEANSQSAKVSLEKAHDGEVVQRAYKNVLEYARYLYDIRELTWESKSEDCSDLSQFQY